VRSPLIIVASLSVALALGGCALTRTPSTAANTPTGTPKQIGIVINDLSSDASGQAGASTICSKVLSAALVARLNKAGGCKTIIANQLETIDDFSFTIERISTGLTAKSRTAIARVQTVYNGKKQIDTLQLVNQGRHGGWRINSLQ
jgi:hypothetical protein